MPIVRALFDENGHTISVTTMHAIGTGAMYLTFLAREFDAV